MVETADYFPFLSFVGLIDFKLEEEDNPLREGMCMEGAEEPKRL